MFRDRSVRWVFWIFFVTQSAAGACRFESLAPDVWEVVHFHHGEPSVKPRGLVGQIIAGRTDDGGVAYEGRVRRVFETYSDTPGRRASTFEAEIVDAHGRTRIVSLSGTRDEWAVKKDSKITMPPIVSSTQGGVDVSSVASFKATVRHPEAMIGREIRAVTYDDNGRPYEYTGTIRRIHVGENGMRLFAGPVKFGDDVPASWTLEIATTTGLVFPLPLTAGKASIKLGALPDFAKTADGLPHGEVGALNPGEVAELKARAAKAFGGTPTPLARAGQRIAAISVTDRYRVRAIAGTVIRADGTHAEIATVDGATETVRLADSTLYQLP